MRGKKMGSNFDKMDRDIHLLQVTEQWEWQLQLSFFFFFAVSLAIDELSGNYYQTTTFKMEKCYKRTTLPIDKIEKKKKV